jgi:bacteriocin-like protein
MEKSLEPIELDDAELAAVSGGTGNVTITITNSANSFQANNSAVSNSANGGNFHFG